MTMKQKHALTRRTFLKAATASAAAVTLNQGGIRPAAAQLSTDLTAMSIVELSRLIATRAVSPVEVVEATLARIDRLEPRVGAFVTVAPEQARAAARQAEQEIMRGEHRGPLHGIPFGVKDTHYTAGVRTTARTPSLADFVPDFDATVVARLKEAGAVLVGKTNLPEWSFGGATAGTNNPWDLSRTPGGSSGGSAAALAARMLPASTGGDTSASVRAPAALCGVVGMSATYGRVPRHGIVAISWSLDHVGPITRTVEDNAIMLRVIAGHDPHDRSTATVPVPDYTAALQRGIRGMRLGIPERKEIDRHHPDVLRTYDEALRVLEGLGASIRELPMPPTWSVVAEDHTVIRICEAAAYHRPYLLADPDRYGEGAAVITAGEFRRREVEAAMLLTSGQYLRALQVRALFTREFQALFDTFDAYVTPANGAPAGVFIPGETSLNFYRAFNLNGFPAMTMPAGFSTDPAGLPIGIQVVGAPWTEETLYAVGAAYQAVTDWHTRAPTL
jgi:aspartyl-tRNA(Asn)/glutamyl-tRNA(Gln) amidotransferase subunit A